MQTRIDIGRQKNHSIIQEKKWIDLINNDEYKDRIVLVKGNIWGVIDKQLENAFSKFGKIETAEVIYDENGNCNGFGLICFSNTEDASKCIKNSSFHLSERVDCIVTLANEQTLIELFTNGNYEHNSQVLIVRYNILKKCLDYKKYLQRLDDMSTDQIESLAKNELLFNKFISIP